MGQTDPFCSLWYFLRGKPGFYEFSSVFGHDGTPSSNGSLIFTNVLVSHMGPSPPLRPPLTEF